MTWPEDVPPATRDRLFFHLQERSHASCTLPRHFAIALALLGSFATTRAGSVVLLNNLDQPPQPTASTPFVGQSFISGAAEELYGARMQLYPSAPPSSKITLDVEARNADGTVGQTLFSDFSSSYDTTTGVITFLANSPFNMAANTGYWLVLSDPTKRHRDLGLHELAGLPVFVRLWPALVQHLVLFGPEQRDGQTRSTISRRKVRRCSN